MTPSIKEQSAAEGLGSPARAALDAVLERARRELPAAAFNLWFADLAPGALREHVLELGVPNAYVKNWLAGHHMELITASVQQVLGPDVRVKLKIERTSRKSDAPGGPQGADPQASEGSTRTTRAGTRRDQPTLDDLMGPSPFPDRY